MFPSWLKYSPINDVAYCLLCYFFSEKPSGHPRVEVFTSKRFRAWRNVNVGKSCVLLRHIGESPCSSHNNALKVSQDLFNQPMNIRNVIYVQSSDQISKNRVCLKSSIDSIQRLTFQACPLRGHDESPKSKDRGNFLQLIKILASYNDELGKVVLENAPYSRRVIFEKEILHIMSSKVKSYMREEIMDSKFCIIVVESRDESPWERMTIILRFVDKKGFIQEQFFDLVHVKDTKAITLKIAVCGVLSQNGVDVLNICGQGYDGASNKRGRRSGLQASFLKDCPYAYYVHRFAHRLQLVLIAASRELREVFCIRNFFKHLKRRVSKGIDQSNFHPFLHSSILHVLRHIYWGPQAPQSHFAQESLLSHNH